MKKRLIPLCALLAILPATSAMAYNYAPPAGTPIIDLAGLPTTSAYTTYTGTFIATAVSTDITFALREDPAFISLSNISVTDTLSPSTNLILNGNFSGATTTVGTQLLPADWLYQNINAATFAGTVHTGNCPTGSTSCWYDGSVQAYDSLSQYISTTIGHTYTILFSAADNGPLALYSQISTNGQTGSNNTAGNGADVVVYAGNAVTLQGSVPEPAMMMLLASGLLGFGVSRKKAKQA